MIKLYSYNGKILSIGDKLRGCCCDVCEVYYISRSLTANGILPVGFYTLKYTVTIPEKFQLPVKIFGNGNARDKIKIDGQNFMIGPENADPPNNLWQRTWISNDRTFTIETEDLANGPYGDYQDIGYTGEFYITTNTDLEERPQNCIQNIIANDFYPVDVNDLMPDPIFPPP